MSSSCSIRPRRERERRAQRWAQGVTVRKFSTRAMPGAAEAAARAAHGSLGTLLGIDISAYSPPPPRPMMMMAKGVAQSDTPINPGEETLAVEVSTRWRFIPGQ